MNDTVVKYLILQKPEILQCRRPRVHMLVLNSIKDWASISIQPQQPKKQDKKKIKYIPYHYRWYIQSILTQLLVNKL